MGPPLPPPLRSDDLRGATCITVLFDLEVDGWHTVDKSEGHAPPRASRRPWTPD